MFFLIYKKILFSLNIYFLFSILYKTNYNFFYKSVYKKVLKREGEWWPRRGEVQFLKATVSKNVLILTPLFDLEVAFMILLPMILIVKSMLSNKFKF